MCPEQTVTHLSERSNGLGVFRSTGRGAHRTSGRYWRGGGAPVLRQSDRRLKPWRVQRLVDRLVHCGLR